MFVAHNDPCNLHQDLYSDLLNSQDCCLAAKASNQSRHWHVNHPIKCDTGIEPNS